MVAFADQDDIWLPHKLARGVTALRAEIADAPALYCARQILTDQDLNPIGRSLKLDRPAGFPASLIQNVTTGCTLVLNRPAARLVAASTPPPATQHDWWCYLAVTAAGGKLIADDEATMLYRQHPANLIGGTTSMPRRALAALRRGRATYMEVLRQHLAALLAQPHLTSPHARTQLDQINRALHGSLLQRLRALLIPGLRRQTLPETAAFSAWFLAG